MQRNPETCQLMDELETMQDQLLADLESLNKQIERLLVEGQLSIRRSAVFSASPPSHVALEVEIQTSAAVAVH